MGTFSRVGLSEDPGKWPWTVSAPWTAEQVEALNVSQQHSPERLREYCPSPRHAKGQNWRGPLMTATAEGWICPDSECGARASSVYPIVLARGAALAAKSC